ncbi:MAG TPA: efflux RND transporter permease subunit [Candidatus Baltobacteraceae bacterium]|nr:efflux RND transporter permease subunit [Candidatus Baltobacteraceae bacterium]
MTEFFLRRPIFAAVCSLVILIAGLVVIPTLPIAQYPEIAPPVVSVSAVYIGASPESVESAVTTPLENAINGVEGLRYINSTSTQGVSNITCTFNLGTNLDTAATDVNNAVQSAMGQLPNEVKQTGVTVNKNSGSFVMALAITSDNSKYDSLFLSNYAELNVVNDLKRIYGVSNVQIFGQRRYAMRIWLNPSELQARGLAASDVVLALQEQNVNVAAGSIGGPPEATDQPYTYTVNAVGRLTDPAQFRNIVLKANPNGGFTTLGEVARVDIGAEDYSSFIRFDGNQNVVGMGVLQLPTANALAVSKGVLTRMDQLSKGFPQGVHYQVAFNSTTFVQESIREVVITLLLSIVLVVLVIFLFLQDPKSTLIPAATIPVSLIGTFFVMKIFGFTINTITLFGLTLATGLVVDDAIVVIENIARYIHEHHMEGVEGASLAMREIQSAVVASSLVLLAVFVPVAFFPGTTGQLYKQFALTIAASISISLFAALTLAPMLSARLLGAQLESETGFFGGFNRSFHAFREWYRHNLPKMFKARWLVFAVFVGALVLTAFLFKTTPTGFIPNEDQGYFIALVQAPEGTSLANEHKIALKAEKIIRNTPGVQDVFDVGGFSFSGSGPNRGIMFAQLRPWSQRKGFAESMTGILYAGPNAIVPRFSREIPEASVLAFNPPAINGVGSFGGFQFELEDRGNVGLQTLMNTAYGFMGLANAPTTPLTQVFTQFRINSPQLQVNIDRNKVKAVGLSLSDVFNTMQVDLGSLYVNDFNYLNRSYRVYVQADMPFRNRVSSLQQLYVRSSNGGGLTPISALVNAQVAQAAPVISHYNLFRNIELNGQNKQGYGSGQAIEAMQQLAKKLDPAGVSYEWSGLTLDEIQSGSQSALIFALGLVFVFLVLSAQYESFIDPLVVILAVPAALLGALLFMNFRLVLGHLMGAGLPLPFVIIFALIGGDPTLSQDAYAQVGYVMLIGLASKSAILIVEFANQQMDAGADVVTAALRAAQTRLRPILMTSIAFVIAVTPLVYASGAGSASRHSLGTVVFGGMLISTVLNLAITPVLYIIIKSLAGHRRRPTNGSIHGLIKEETPTATVPSNV